MKNSFILILYFLLLLGGNADTNSYNYNTYSAVSTNTNLNGQTITSTTSDQSAVYITSSGITINESTIQKTSGDSSNTENSEFYGINAAVLVQGGGVTITDSTITTSAKGANAICATNNGKVTISKSTITSTGSGSARGLHATYGGTIEASDMIISSTGGSCATLATDRGEGTVTCTGCTLSTAGAGSPLIYSTGTITVSECTGTSTNAQMVVVEGKNTANVESNSSLKATGLGNRNNVDNCGVFLYQSMSGDADTGTSIFNCKDSTLEIDSSSSVYSSAPMFFITNTDSQINLEDCSFNYGSGTFLNAAGTSEWGKSGSNGGTVTLTLTNQDVEGDFVVDSISSLTINMVNSSIKGKINNSKISTTIAVSMDSNSKIYLTGDSYLSSLTNSDSTGSNINKGSYIFADINGNSLTATGTFNINSTSTFSTDNNENIDNTDNNSSPNSNIADTIINTDENINETDTFTRIRINSGLNLSLSIIYLLFVFIIIL